MGEAVFGQEALVRRAPRGVAGETDSVVQQQGLELMARSQTDGNGVVARSKQIAYPFVRLLWDGYRSQITGTTKMRKRQGVARISFRALTRVTWDSRRCDDVAPRASTARLACQTVTIGTRLTYLQKLRRKSQVLRRVMHPGGLFGPVCYGLRQNDGCHTNN